MLTPKVLGIFLIIAGLLGYIVSVILNNKLVFFYSCMSGLFGIAACIRILANPETLKKKYFLVFGIKGEVSERLVIQLCSVEANVFVFRQHVNKDVLERLIKQFPHNLIPIEKSGKCDDYTDSLAQIESVLQNKTLKGVIFADDECVPGEIELMPQQRISDMLQTNVVEVVTATKAFLPLLRESKGRIIFLGHVFGRFALPSFSAISLTKAAIEGFADGLRHEMRRFDVKVIIVERCAHSSLEKERLSNSYILSSATEDARRTYRTKYIENVNQMKKVIGSNSPVLQTIIEAIAAENPKDRYIACAAQKRFCLSKLETIASQFVPATVMDIWVDLFHSLPSVSQVPIPAQK